VQRALDPALLAVVTHGLRGRRDVILIEAAEQRRTAMPRRPERDAFGGLCWVGLRAEIRGYQAWHVREQCSRCGAASQRVHAGHLSTRAPSTTTRISAQKPRGTSLSQQIAGRVPVAELRVFACDEGEFDARYALEKCLKRMLSAIDRGLYRRTYAGAVVTRKHDLPLA